jgi:ATP-dependent phosphofructokinase / diphosphate-dependent phosphofructokinase
LGGAGNAVAQIIARQTGFETRSVILGHLQRGGPPSASDRVLATRLGLAASRLVLQKRFGTMAVLAGNQIVEAPLDEGVAVAKSLDLSYYDEAAAFFN